MKKQNKEKIIVKQFKDIWEHGRCYCPTPIIEGTKCKKCLGDVKE